MPGSTPSKIKTRAVLKGDRYIVNGQKIWTSTAQQADKIVLLARTTPIEECAKPTDGLTLFYTDLDRSKIEVREIPKMGRHAVNSNQTFYRRSGSAGGASHRRGRQGLPLHPRQPQSGAHPERAPSASASDGARSTRAVNYANERVVFGRPIGQNQSIQHPLAESWSELLAAELMTLHAAELYDARQALRRARPTPRSISRADAGFHACDRAVRTHGGMGYAQEFHVERYFREVVIAARAGLPAS